VSRATPASRVRGDHGAGLISTAFGVLAFLVLMLFTAQLLVNLFFASMVTSAAHDAASGVAHAGSQPPSNARLGEAEDEFRDRLGAAGDEARVRWDTSRPDVVELVVTVPYPQLGSSGLQIPYFERLERRVQVRVEQVQD
jgi:hypothetical protein